jgi:hypothetical protein
MGRTRDVSKILTSNTSILSLASASSTYLQQINQSMVHISTSDASSASTNNFDNIFNSSYKSYLLHFNFQLSGSTTIALRFRTGGTSNSTSNYNTQLLNMNTTTVAGSRTYGGSSGGLSIANISSGACTLSVINAFSSSKETFWTNHNITGADAALTGGNFAATTSFDGISFIPASGNITSTLSVWGLRV